jgi:hypothetical protein
MVLSVFKNAEIYNRRDSQMVTHSGTSRPFSFVSAYVCMAERTGFLALTWFLTASQALQRVAAGVPSSQKKRMRPEAHHRNLEKAGWAVA